MTKISTGIGGEKEKWQKPLSGSPALKPASSSPRGTESQQQTSAGAELLWLHTWLHSPRGCLQLANVHLTKLQLLWRGLQQ